MNSTNFLNNTFNVDEIDIDTKRPRVEQSTPQLDFCVKQIKLKETRFSQNQKINFNTPPNSAKNNNPMRIKQRVLTPYQQDLTKLERNNFRNLNLSTIVSSGEARMIPDIVVTEFLDDENADFIGEDKENHRQVIKKDIKLNCKSTVRIKPAPPNPSCQDKCQCCNKSVMKIGEDKIFVSNSVQANLAIDEFSVKTHEINFEADSLSYLGAPPNQNPSPDSYDNDYYLMNEFISKEKPKPETVVPVKYFYFYCTAEKYAEISRKRLIKLEPMLIDGELKNAITLLTIPPTSSDLCLLNEIFERNTAIDLKRIESYIMIKRDNIEKHGEHLVKVNENKFLFKKSIILQGDFPKNWMKAKSK